MLKSREMNKGERLAAGHPSSNARAYLAAFVCLVITVSLIAVPSVTSSWASTPPTPTISAYRAPYLGSPPASNPYVVAVIASAASAGYYVLRSNGEVDAYGVRSYGSFSAAGPSPGVTAVGIALDSKTGGYWVLDSNGAVKAFNAPSYGETLVPAGGWGQHPAAVGIAAAPDGHGYYVLRVNGAVYAYGAQFHGSLAGRLAYRTTAPVVAVAIAVDPTTGGYWIATSIGSVANFDAPNRGYPLATAHGRYNGVPVSALAATPNGSGYYVLKANGEIELFGTTLHGARVESSTPPVGAIASAIAVDAATGGYYVGIDDTPFDGYLNPLRGVTSLLPQEVDQGADYCASGPVYALGAGVVKSLYDSGWPSGVFISYQLTRGPAKGRYVYVAENVTPKVTIGERVSATTVVGVVHDAKTCFETGWADPPSSPERAAAHGEYNGKNSTAYGLNFNALLEVLGARPGLTQPFGPPGPLPVGWPTWSITSS